MCVCVCGAGAGAAAREQENRGGRGVYGRDTSGASSLSLMEQNIIGGIFHSVRLRTGERGVSLFLLRSSTAIFFASVYWVLIVPGNLTTYTIMEQFSCTSESYAD